MPRGAQASRQRWLAVLLALVLAGVLLGVAWAADPGSKDDPLATVSFVTRRAQFTRVELAPGQLFRLGSGAELVIAEDSLTNVEFEGLDPARDELINLTTGARASGTALFPFQHYVNAGARELKLKPARDTVLLLRGEWR
jgi:hypothetical protein